MFILPHLNVVLNTTCATLLVLGVIKIRQGRVHDHMWLMIAAFFTSTMFLTSYLIYHWNVGSVGYNGTGGIRSVYMFILITHSFCASLVPPMSAVTIWRAGRGDFERHRFFARITVPIWLYSSISGVLVYLFLYIFNPPK